MAPKMMARFWGASGSRTICDRKLGGQTACVEIIFSSKERLILDAGSGLADLGSTLGKEQPLKTNILLSHLHYDHVLGLPFFTPLFHPQSEITLWAGHLSPDAPLSTMMERLFSYPFFPCSYRDLPGRLRFRDFAAGEPIQTQAPAEITTTKLNHPGGATGYRISANGQALCYITDHEHQGAADPTLVDFIQGAQVVIYDTAFTEKEYAKRRGWGHSTWQAGADLCARAQAKTLVLFHHDPTHSDDDLQAMARAAAAHRPGTLIAYTGLEISL